MHVALLDSFNTSTALEILADIVSKTNAYIGANSKTSSNPDAYLSLAAVSEVARWVTHMVTVFGFVPDRQAIGWGSGSAASADGAVPTEETLEPLARVLSRFRDAVKQGALAANKSPEARETFAQRMLALSDTVRDDDLPQLGIALEDRNAATGEPALVKFAPAAELVAQREEKRRIAAEKEANKEAQRLKREREEEEKREKARVKPQDMFKPKSMEGTDGTWPYSEWDEDGFPTKLQDGRELPLAQKKKLQKEREAQRKLHEKYFPPETQS